MVWYSQLIACMVIILNQAAVATGPSCTAYAADAPQPSSLRTLIGGGFLSDTEYVTIHNYANVGTHETHVRVWNVADGSFKRSWSPIQLGGYQAITCNAKGLVMVAQMTLFPDTTNPVLVPYVYYPNGTLLDSISRSSFATYWQMYFSPSCDRILVRSDDQKSQTYDVSDLKGGNINNFASSRDGKWMQLISDTEAYTGLGRKMRKLSLTGSPGDGSEKKILLQFKVTGGIKNFAISPDGRFMFATGNVIGKPNKVFKNVVRLFNVVKPLAIDASPLDVKARYTAFSPTAPQFAGTFSRSTTDGSNGALKIYKSGGFNGTLAYTLLDGNNVNQLYYSPNGKNLLVLGDPTQNTYYMCRNMF